MDFFKLYLRTEVIFQTYTWTIWIYIAYFHISHHYLFIFVGWLSLSCYFQGFDQLVCLFIVQLQLWGSVVGGGGGTGQLPTLAPL